MIATKRTAVGERLSPAPAAVGLRANESPHVERTTRLAPDVAGALDRLSVALLRAMEMVERGTPAQTDADASRPRATG